MLYDGGPVHICDIASHFLNFFFFFLPNKRKKGKRIQISFFFPSESGSQQIPHIPVANTSRRPLHFSTPPRATVSVAVPSRPPSVPSHLSLRRAPQIRGAEPVIWRRRWNARTRAGAGRCKGNHRNKRGVKKKKKKAIGLTPLWAAAEVGGALTERPLGGKPVVL